MYLEPSGLVVETEIAEIEAIEAVLKKRGSRKPRRWNSGDVLVGDTLKSLNSLSGLSLDLILAELPWGLESLPSEKRMVSLLEGFLQVRKTGGNVVLFCNREIDLQMRLLGDSVFGCEHFADSMLWLHGSSGESLAAAHLKTDLSPAASRSLRKSDSVLFWCFDPETRRDFRESFSMAEICGGHDAPMVLFQDLIDRLSPFYGTVLVPFADSPTACIAAGYSHREWMGMCKKPGRELEREFRDSGVSHRMV